MKDSILIQNLKCGGCAATITKVMNAFPEVSNLHIDFETAAVQFETPDATQHAKYERALTEAGYPPQGATNTTGRKVRSYISCALGRLDG